MTVTLEEKIGQMLMLAFAGERLDQARILVQKHHVGACYLGQDNARTPAEAVQLTGRLQALAAGSGQPVPMLLGADQEGTWGVMVPHTATGPGNLALGAAADEEVTRRMYRVLGEELRTVGYNTVFAPCVDVNSNPENPIIGMRSFGERPEEVARMAAAAVRGAREGGVITTAKHFPGHGNTASDSHRGIPRVDRARGDLERIDLLPFRAAIDAGVDLVMTSHILFPEIDAENPATLSRSILTGLLREEMGFGGVVLSDSMNMGAIRRHYDPAEAAVKAVLAGVDMIMLAEEHYDHDAARYLDKQVLMIRGMADAVRRGELPEGRVDDAVSRIVSLKKRLPAQAGELSSVGGASHRAVETEAAERAVCRVWDRGGLLPLRRGCKTVVVNATARASYPILTRTRGIGPNQAEPAFDAFARELREKLPGVSVIEADALLSGGSIPAEVEAADAVVVALEDYTLPGVSFGRESHAKVLQRLRPLGTRVVLAALCDPYVLRGGEGFAAAVCTCSSRTVAAAAAARAICGIIPFRGRLPVSI